MSATTDPANRGPATVAIMMSAVMHSLDTTIANVALPHMQASLGAAADQITWVLTSYIVASALMTPLSGWLARRIGGKRLFMISIVAFVLTSMLCGLANGLAEEVIFRILQALAGASLVPLSQSLLLDMHPPERHGQTMAVWGAGVLIGPILGPVLGGWLTEHLSWRWCFFINLPLGILGILGVWMFLGRDVQQERRRFDFLGFGMLTLFVGCAQLLMDRGPGQDWFSSAEIWTYLVLAMIGLWVFVIHTATTAHPFFDPSLIRDRNFVTACGFGFLIAILLFSTLSLLPPMLQNVLGYPVYSSGILTAPRGVGAITAMFFVGRLVGKVDVRLVLLTGLIIASAAMWQMMHFDLSMPWQVVAASGLTQGFGMGLVFVPLSTIAFTTISPALRSEGAAVYTLIRTIGGSVGISLMQALMVANTQIMHGSLAAHLATNDPVVQASLPAMFNPGTTAGLMALNAEVTRQATMVAYVDDYKLMFILNLTCIPLLLLMRNPRRKRAES